MGKFGDTVVLSEQGVTCLADKFDDTVLGDKGVSFWETILMAQSWVSRVTLVWQTSLMTGYGFAIGLFYLHELCATFIQ